MPAALETWLTPNALNWSITPDLDNAEFKIRNYLIEGKTEVISGSCSWSGGCDHCYGGQQQQQQQQGAAGVQCPCTLGLAIPPPVRRLRP
jgi:hypothetical protein